MQIKIENCHQLESVMYTWIQQHKNCTIELLDINAQCSIYFSTCKLPNDTLLISMTINDKSIGNTVQYNDGKAIMNWIKDKCKLINFEQANIVALLNVTETQQQNFSLANINLNKDVKRNTPIMISTINDGEELFMRFLRKKECNKMVMVFAIAIPDLKVTFRPEVIIDKFYLYDKPLISFSVTRTQGINDIECCCIMDCLFEDEECLSNLIDAFYEFALGTFKRCMRVSDEEISVYVHTDNNLI